MTLRKGSSDYDWDGKEKLFEEVLETHDAIQTVLDHLHHRKDVEVYVSLMHDLEDLMVTIAQDMKGLQDGRGN